jgi:Uma2 family endonuclease
MAEAGVFGPEDRIELVDGELIDMAPIGQSQAAIVTGLNRAFSMACAGRALVSPQNPVRINRLSMPQPDFAVLRNRADLYATGTRPGPGDTLLLVEVADSSLPFDRTVKLPLYARAGIAEFWIVDLRRRAVDAYRHPSETGYGEVTTYQAGDQVALASIPEIVVTIDLVFG